MNDRVVKPAALPFLARLINNLPVHVALVVLLGVAAYANTFHAPFQYDDYQSLLELPYLQDLRYLTDWSLAGQYAAEHNFRMRFVGNLTFALNYALHGTDVVGYHIVNLAIHLVNALLVYSLVRLTFRTPFFEIQHSELITQNSKFKIQNFIALFAALLFVAHPVQTQAVTYIVQRLTSLATLFYLACLVLYIKARENFAGQGGTARGVCWYGASLCCAVLAMKTKEIAFTLPVAVSLYEFMFFRGEWKRRAVYLVPLLLTMLVIPLTLIGTYGAPGDSVGQMTRVDSDLSRWEYLCTELRVIVTYLRLLLLPVHQNLIYDYPVYRTLFTPPVFLSFLLLAALFGLAVYLVYKSSSKFQVSGFKFQGSPVTGHQSPVTAFRLIAFGIFWFFLALSVESSVIPIMDVIFEHRLYLPSVGAFIALATCCGMVAKRLGAKRKGWETAVAALAGLIVLALTGATYARNDVWRSQESLWQDVVNKSPGKAAAYQNLGIALYGRGEVARAFACFDRAIAIDPEFAESFINRGTIWAKSGDFARAINDFERAVAVAPELAVAWNNLGLAWSEVGNQERALGYLARSIALDPRYVKPLNNTGLALIRKGEPGKAIPYLDRALSLNRNYDMAYFNRGVAYLESGRPDRAIADLTRAVELNPRLAAAYTRRGQALAQTGARERALDDFRMACENNDENGCRQLQLQRGNR
jgi:tetratricopeptide (TPR) repeat protein